MKRIISLKHRYDYTPNNQIESITRAFGTKDARTITYTYTPSGKIATKTLPDTTTLIYQYHPLGYLCSLISSDQKIHYNFKANKNGQLLSASNGEITIQRILDPSGNVLKETFPYFEIIKEYDQFDRCTQLTLGNQGQVLYTYDPLFLRSVKRISSNGSSYQHVYEEYDLAGNLLTESLIGNLGKVFHTTNLKGQKASIVSPYFSQKCTHDSAGNLINNTIDQEKNQYTYDNLSQLISEKNNTYSNDSLYNRTQQNNHTSQLNNLNELLSLNNTLFSYDLNGNTITKQTHRFTYDPLNQLIETKNIRFIYDPLGRRLSKITGNSRENYIYDGQNEIGALSNNILKNLKILGHTTVAIELENQPFAPLLDAQGNICRLVNPRTKNIEESYEFTAFGKETKNYTNPWRFASKRFDPELNLIYFGKRYYDPEFGRWLTTDPAGFVDSTNLYQYVFNNPLRYQDHDGQFAFLLPLAIPLFNIALPTLAITLPTATQLAVIAGTAVIATVGYKAIESANRWDQKHIYGMDDQGELKLQLSITQTTEY